MTNQTELHKQLIAAAKEAAKQSYSPYSEFPVGAAILTASGKVITGCNVENASYTSICAERTAIVKAISEGHREFKAIAVACLKSPDSWPCGNCRQFICEFGLDMDILTEDKAGNIHCMKFSELLPHSFGPHSLPT
jgi:cytidine deaminase